MIEAEPRSTRRLPHKASRPVKPPTPPSVVVIDREGMVIGMLASRVEARAFLRGGCA